MIIILAIVTYRCVQSAWFLCISVTLAISGITFLPWIKDKLHYSETIQIVVFGLPLLIPYFTEYFLGGYTQISKSFSPAIIPIVFVLCFYTINHNHISHIFSSPFSKFPIEKREFIKLFGGNVYQIICEELFFRKFMINSLLRLTSSIIAIVVISSLFFVLAHFANRWAPKIFTIYSYLGQLILGAVISFSYIMGLPIVACVCIHSLYNVESLLPLLLRLFARHSDWSDFD